MIFERFPLGNLEKILKIIREYSSKCSKQFHFWQQKTELRTDVRRDQIAMQQDILLNFWAKALHCWLRGRTPPPSSSSSSVVLLAALASMAYHCYLTKKRRRWAAPGLACTVQFSDKQLVLLLLAGGVRPLSQQI
jgi:hypothetical protein